jgi:hypothetical protein
MDREALINLLEELKALRRRWCAESVDDEEDMWTEIPAFLDRAVPEMEKALGIPPSTLVIDEAIYGTEDTVRDVIDFVREAVILDSLHIKVDNRNLGGDPVPGQAKTLTVTYQYAGEIKTVSAREQQILKIN